MIGRTLGRYRITAKLGEGGNATVWLAHDGLLDRGVALKVPANHLIRDDDARQRFLREARAASSLHHPGIATVYDAGEDGDELFIAFQCIEGTTVAKHAGRDGIPLPDAVRIAREASEALRYAHGHGVIHRDITADNLMVANDGRAVIVDFGLALPSGAARFTRTGGVIGTLPYLAPEVAKGERADARADLYGLGVVLYRMVTGRLPFDGTTEAEIIQRVLNETPPRPSRLRPGVPRSLDRLIMRLLEKDPAQRYPSAEGLLDDLRRQPELDRARAPGAWGWLLDGMEVTASHLGRRMRRPVFWSTAAAVVALVTAGAWVMYDRVISRVPHQRYRSIAVLPFQDDGRSPPAAASLADGMGEELSKQLYQLGEQPSRMHVTPWFTSSRVTNLGRPLRAIARQLGVDGLVVGTIRVEEDRLYATISLVDGASGDLRWLREFQEPMGSAIAMQRGLATAAAGELSGFFTSQERRMPSSTYRAGPSETP